MNRKIGVILSYVLMAFEVLSTLLLTPFIIRTLGQAEYGVYKLVFAINAYLLLADLGIGNAIIRFIAKYRVENNKEKERQFLAVATIFYSAMAVIALIIGMILIFIFPTVFANGLSAQEIRLGQILLSITMANSAVTIGTAAYNNILIAYEKFVVSRITSIGQIIVRMILTYIVLVIGWGSIGILLVNLLMTIICRSYFAIYVFMIINLKPLFQGINFLFIKGVVVYSSFIFIQMIATLLNSTVDQILIGSLVKSSAVILAVYGVGSQIVQYYQSIGSAFTNVLMPGVVKLVERKASPTETVGEMIRVGRIIFMVLALIWCGFLVCGHEFVNLWAGAQNSQAYIVAIILMFAYMFVLTESIGTQILWAMNQHKEQAILKIIIVLLNIIFSIILIKWTPLIGATIGTFISLAIGDIAVMNIIFRKKLNINLCNYYKGIFKGIVPCLLVTVGIGLLASYLMPDGWLWLCIKVFIMVLSYIIIMYLFGMSKYEHNLCYSFLKKIKNFGEK